MLVLILARADDAVSRAVGHHIDAAEAGESALDDPVDGVAGAHIADCVQ